MNGDPDAAVETSALDAAAESMTHGAAPTTMENADGDDVDKCEAIVGSISALASSMAAQISELEECRPGRTDTDRAMLALGNLMSLQTRLQHMRSRLLAYGRRLQAPPEPGRDVSSPSRPSSTALPSDVSSSGDQVCDRQPVTGCRRVAMLTFGPWTRQMEDVLQRSGLVTGRGHFGCFYLVHLSRFEKEYLEIIRRPRFYNLIAEEHRTSEIAALIGSLPRSRRGRLQREEVLELPVTEDESMLEDQAVARPSSSSSTPGARSSSGASAANVPGSLLQLDQPSDVSLQQRGVPDSQMSVNGEADQFAWTPVSVQQRGVPDSQMSVNREADQFAWTPAGDSLLQFGPPGDVSLQQRGTPDSQPNVNGEVCQLARTTNGDSFPLFGQPNDVQQPCVHDNRPNVTEESGQVAWTPAGDEDRSRPGGAEGTLLGFYHF